MQQTATAKSPAFFPVFGSTVCALRFHKTKLTLGNGFVVDHFPLGGRKVPKHDERTFF